MGSYVERAVHPALAPHVVCTWIDPAAEPRHPVLPDGCIDIVWDGRYLQVAGPDTGPTPITGDATFVGIRFRPGAAPGFLGVAASELLDRSVALADVWGCQANELADRLAEIDVARAPGLLERTLLQRVDAVPASDPLVADLLRELGQGRGPTPSVGSLARRLHVSERTLRRRCASAIGYGPKTLDRILRFRRALRLVVAEHPLVDTAQLAGYVDQAHLTREFQRLAGVTPGNLHHLPPFVISANGCPT